MAYYTDVTVLVGERVIGAAPRAGVGLPGQHALTITDMIWTEGERNCLRYLQAACKIRAMAPGNNPVSLELKISGILGNTTTVHLD